MFWALLLLLLLAGRRRRVAEPKICDEDDEDCTLCGKDRVRAG